MKRKLSILLATALLLCLLLPAAALADYVSMAQSGGSLYLRSGPGREYKAVGIVNDGDYITVVSYGSIWSKIKTSGGKTGYIKNLYIDDGDEDYAAGTGYFNSSYSMYTTATVKMRAGASTSTSVITNLKKGTKVTALGKNGGFYLVQTKGGTQGYVSGNYLSKKSAGSSTSGSSSSKKTKTVTARYVNVRAGGGMSYRVLRVLPYGTKVTVLKVGNYWTRIQYGSTTGWIKNTYLK